MRYSKDIDYLVSSIIYLATHSYYWARSPRALAIELSLNEERLTQVFNGFPGIFRKSSSITENGQHYYSLQARYAQREGKDTVEPDKVSYIEPLSTNKISLLLEFVQNMAEHENLDQRLWRQNSVAVAAAVVSAVTAVIVAIIK